MMQSEFSHIKKIGLTGGIASGKSTVSSYLQTLGAHIIDADIISREIMHKGSTLVERLKDEFGSHIVKNDGTLNRALMRKLVFSDASKLKKLNSIVHPEIIKRIDYKILHAIQSSIPVVVVDAALLIETGMYKNMDQVWLVYLQKQQQIERLIKRDNISYQDAVNMINSQMQLNKKIEYADYIIDNSGSKQYTFEQVRMLWEKVLSEVYYR